MVENGIKPVYVQNLEIISLTRTHPTSLGFYTFTFFYYESTLHSVDNVSPCLRSFYSLILTLLHLFNALPLLPFFPHLSSSPPSLFYHIFHHPSIQLPTIPTFIWPFLLVPPPSSHFFLIPIFLILPLFPCFIYPTLFLPILPISLSHYPSTCSNPPSMHPTLYAPHPRKSKQLFPLFIYFKLSIPIVTCLMENHLN